MSGALRWTALGAAVFAISLLRSLADGPGLSDESWFLQVVHRVRSGEVLYRDVFFGATPLSVYVTALLTWATGIEIVAVKTVTNACFAAAMLLTCRIALQLGLPAVGPIVAGSVLLGRPYANPPYTPLASALLLATMSTALANDQMSSRPSIVQRRVNPSGDLLTGSLAGLSFAAKQNVGLLALAAAVVSILIPGLKTGPRRGQIHRCMLTTLGFGGAAGLALLPVFLDGGLAALWEYGFAGKGAYLQYGRIGYLTSVRAWLAAAADLPAASAVLTLVHGTVLALPLAAGGVAGYLLWKRRIDRHGGVLVVFGVASVLSAFPRWDRFHLAYAVPGLLLVLAHLSSRLHGYPAVCGQRVRVGRRVAVAICLVLILVRPVIALVSEARRPSTLPHFRGAFLTAGEERRLAETASRLATAAGGEAVFILSLRAGSLYLASGVRNPTPFDMPAVTAVGRSGIPWLLGELSRGAISRVCLAGRPEELGLTDVRAFVQTHFQRGGDIGPCTMYRGRIARSVLAGMQ